jgi:hypothetical protein
MLSVKKSGSMPMDFAINLVVPEEGHKFGYRASSSFWGGREIKGDY